MVICVSGPVRQDEPNNQDVASYHTRLFTLYSIYYSNSAFTLLTN